MIKGLIPLTKNKLLVLSFLYNEDSSYLKNISRELKLHQYSLKKTINSLANNKILIKENIGKTIVYHINKLENMELLYHIIEDHKAESANRRIQPLIKDMQRYYSDNKPILSCCLFGSWARGGETRKSDVDLLFIVKNKELTKEIEKRCSRLSKIFELEINPIVADEEEFLHMVETKDPATISLLNPKQRILIIGVEYFLRVAY